MTHDGKSHAADSQFSIIRLVFFPVEKTHLHIRWLFADRVPQTLIDLVNVSTYLKRVCLILASMDTV
jgi:hypothetical protein